MRISDWSSDVCSSDLLYDRLNGLGHWVPGTSPGTTAVAVERECALLGELHQRPCHHVSGAPTCPTAASSSATPSMPICWRTDRQSTRLNSSHQCASRMPSPA